MHGSGIDEIFEASPAGLIAVKASLEPTRRLYSWPSSRFIVSTRIISIVSANVRIDRK